MFTLQDRLRQQQAEHSRQQAEQRALVSDVIDHVMVSRSSTTLSPPFTSTCSTRALWPRFQVPHGCFLCWQARPLTKRQEALAARKKEEAATTLVHSRRSPLPVSTCPPPAVISAAVQAGLQRMSQSVWGFRPCMEYRLACKVEASFRNHS